MKTAIHKCASGFINKLTASCWLSLSVIYNTDSFFCWVGKGHGLTLSWNTSNWFLLPKFLENVYLIPSLPNQGGQKNKKKDKKAWEFVDTIPLYIGNSCTVLCYIERFSNDCRKPKTKAITPSNHDRGKQRDEPITILSNYIKLEQSAGKITRTWRNWFWFCFSLAEKLARVF